MSHIFFDLDHTLWDFEANARETLYQLFDEYRLHQYSHHSKEEFVAIYNKINDDLWVLYNRGKIEKEALRTDRFVQTFLEMGYPEHKVPSRLWEHYISICPTKTNLVDGCMEVLDYLSARYDLHLITNGFAETQARKLKHSGLGKYFGSITVSELSGYQKPHPQIFETALKNAGISGKSSSHVGDSFDADVMGGINSGWNVYWLHSSHNPDYDHERLVKIKKLRELLNHF